MHNSTSTDRPQYTRKRVGTQTAPGHPNRPHRGAHPPNRQHACAHILHPQTHTDTHQRNPENQEDRSSQPRAQTHFQPTPKTQTTLGRGHVRARPALGTHHLHLPTHQRDSPNTAAARCRDSVRGAGTTPHALPMARGSGEDKPAPDSALAMMDGLTDIAATSRVSSSRSN